MIDERISFAPANVDVCTKLEKQIGKLDVFMSQHPLYRSGLSIVLEIDTRARIKEYASNINVIALGCDVKRAPALSGKAGD